jgi:hypothetical protein
MERIDNCYIHKLYSKIRELIQVAKPIVVDDLISQIRAQIDERNVDVVTDSDILQALNRAQDYAADILARQYVEPLLTYKDITLLNNQQTYDIPEDAFEDRILKLETIIRGIHYELKNIKFTQVASYEIPTPQQIPSYYSIVGKQFRIIPASIGQYTLRLWYLKEPETLQVSQGRITNLGSNYVLVDQVGPDVTTPSNASLNYVNLIDAQSGLIKATMQVQAISGNKLTFKAIPDETTVYGKTVVGTLPATLEKNDYVAIVTGTCVPTLKKPFTNFFIQYAVAEIKRRLGDPDTNEQSVLKEFEKQVERSWVGREQETRISKRSRNWLFPRRRLYS